MALETINKKDYEGKGVRNQSDVPGLTAEEMKAAVEQIVIEVAIPKINEIILYLLESGATKEDLQNLLVEAGSVTSVFGRAGAVKPEENDYTAEMVHAAKERHAENHKTGGADALSASDIGAAEKLHAHGNISGEGKIGNTNGKVIMTGLGGVLEAKEKADCGFILPPATKDIVGEFTAEDNVVYFGHNIMNFIFSCDAEKTASCHGWVVFDAPGIISLSGFDFIDDPDDIASAEEGSRWEFDLAYGCLIIRKRSE